jgi:hypothetical protein
MAVVQAGSMSKAAVLLNTGQSAISRSVGQLERPRRLPVERGPRGVEATQFGRVLLMVEPQCRSSAPNGEEHRVSPSPRQAKSGSGAISPWQRAVSAVVDLVPALSAHHVSACDNGGGRAARPA